jgi:hypothetical protein
MTLNERKKMLELNWDKKRIADIPFEEAVIMLELCSEDIMRQAFALKPDMDRFSALVSFRALLRDRILSRA